MGILGDGLRHLLPADDQGAVDPRGEFLLARRPLVFGGFQDRAFLGRQGGLLLFAEDVAVGFLQRG